MCATIPGSSHHSKMRRTEGDPLGPAPAPPAPAAPVVILNRNLFMFYTCIFHSTFFDFLNAGEIINVQRVCRISSPIAHAGDPTLTPDTLPLNKAIKNYNMIWRSLFFRILGIQQRSVFAEQFIGMSVGGLAAKMREINTIAMSASCIDLKLKSKPGNESLVKLNPFDRYLNIVSKLSQQEHGLINYNTLEFTIMNNNMESTTQLLEKGIPLSKKALQLSCLVGSEAIYQLVKSYYLKNQDSELLNDFFDTHIMFCHLMFAPIQRIREFHDLGAKVDSRSLEYLIMRINSFPEREVMVSFLEEFISWNDVSPTEISIKLLLQSRDLPSEKLLVEHLRRFQKAGGVIDSKFLNIAMDCRQPKSVIYILLSYTSCRPNGESLSALFKYEDKNEVQLRSEIRNELLQRGAHYDLTFIEGCLQSMSYNDPENLAHMKEIFASSGPPFLPTQDTFNHYYSKFMPHSGDYPDLEFRIGHWLALKGFAANTEALNLFLGGHIFNPPKQPSRIFELIKHFQDPEYGITRDVSTGETIMSNFRKLIVGEPIPNETTLLLFLLLGVFKTELGLNINHAEKWFTRHNLKIKADNLLSYLDIVFKLSNRIKLTKAMLAYVIDTVCTFTKEKLNRDYANRLLVYPECELSESDRKDLLEMLKDNIID